MGTINVRFLLKFGEKENIEKLFHKGEIYMNTIKRFKEIEQKGIGDKFEGAVEIKNYTNAKVTLKIPDNPMVIDAPKLQLVKSHKANAGNIYSTYAISTLLLKRKNKHYVDKRMSEFGSHCLIIKDVERFINSILNKLQEYDYDYSHNMVRYKNFSKNNHELTLYHKTHLLSYQKEHRIIAYTNKDEPLKFEIGSLKDYAEIHKTENIIKTLVVDYAP